MITKHVYVPVTETSHPFCRAELKSHMAEHGYAEDEYFVYGDANIYSEDQVTHAVTPRYTGCEYVNRVLIRRPKDVSKFSGNVFVEILNPSAHLDIDRFWVNGAEFFMREGDIYIGITGKSDVLDSFMRFDKERYAPLDWHNPDPNRTKPDPLPPMGFDERFETGYLWDILSDYARLLKSDSEMNPLKEYGKLWLYLAGWSQCTGFVNRYVVSFSSRPECKGLYDGFYAAGGSDSLAPINQYEPLPLIGRFFVANGAGMMGCDVPFMAVNTESENAMANWHADSDQPGYLFRHYAFAGTSHDEAVNIDNWYKNDPDFAKAGILDFKYNGVEGKVNDYPYTYLFAATYKILYRWVREKITPPHAEPIEIVTVREADNSYSRCNKTDAFGNAIGGIRTAALNYPTARYFGGSHDKDGRYVFVAGHCEPFSAALLKELYGSLDHYRALVEIDTDEQIMKGFVLPEDKEALVDEIVGLAKERGLE